MLKFEHIIMENDDLIKFAQNFQDRAKIIKQPPKPNEQQPLTPNTYPKGKNKYDQEYSPQDINKHVQKLNDIAQKLYEINIDELVYTLAVLKFTYKANTQIAREHKQDISQVLFKFIQSVYPLSAKASEISNQTDIKPSYSSMKSFM